MVNILNQVNWGIIGCGDVCEVKSGPAFDKVPHSKLIGVMRRNADKAADYAKRHKVPKYYNDAERLINDPEINAIYIATPPATHKEYAIMAMYAGKPVYIEKPLTINSEQTRKLIEHHQKTEIRATGAYYRRRLPLFEKVKSLIEARSIGEPRAISVRLAIPTMNDQIAKSESNWRLNPDISGGGLFHDLAPHMLDILIWIFGAPSKCFANTLIQSKEGKVADYVSMIALFNKNIALDGTWIFDTHEYCKEDRCTITGSEGVLSFSFFKAAPLILKNENNEQSFTFTNHENIQFEMIKDTVAYFRGEKANPCSLEEVLVSMEMLDVVNHHKN